MILVDGNRLPDWSHPSRAVVGGDAICLSIAAAAIVAKQARDAEMAALARRPDGYGRATNAGYGTPAPPAGPHRLARKGVGGGKVVSGRVELGGCRLHKKK